MNTKRIIEQTSNYEDVLIHSLRNKKEATAYLQIALDEYQDDGDIAALLLALRHVTEAQGGITALADKTQLNRQSLYKTLSRQGNPKLKTLGILLKGLGFHLAIEPST